MGLRARTLTVVFVAAAVAAGVIASCSADEATPAVDAGTPAESGSPAEAGTGDASGGDSAFDGADASVPLVDTCKTAGVPFADTWLADPKLCLTVFASELSTARQMAFAPNGDLFVQARGQVVALFDTNGNGVIEEGESEAFATSVDGYPEINHGLAFDTAGAYVYASNRGDNTIAVFRIAPATGMITLVGHVPTGGMTPRSFAIDPSGAWLFAANQSSDTVVAFAIDPATGMPSPTGASLPFDNPSFVGFVALPP